MYNHLFLFLKYYWNEQKVKKEEKKLFAFFLENFAFIWKI